jgi:hypothetical protein
VTQPAIAARPERPAIAAAPAAGRAANVKLPAGVIWSQVWEQEDGTLTKGTVKIPVVEATHRPIGTLWACIAPGCDTATWCFPQAGAADAPEPETPYCPKDGHRLFPGATDATNTDPVAAAREGLRNRARQYMVNKRTAAVEAAHTKAAMFKAEATRAAEAKHRELSGHYPWLAASAATAALGAYAATHTDPAWIAAAVGVGVASCGAIVAYIAAYYVEKRRRRRTVDPDGEGAQAKIERYARRRGRYLAGATIAAGSWSALAVPVGIDVTTLRGQFMWALAAVLTWVVTKSHRDEIRAERLNRAELERRRLDGLARAAAEEAARREQAERDRAAAEAAPPPAEVAFDPENALHVGQQMAQRWQEIIATAVQPPFAINRTWIEPDSTTPIIVPVDGELTRIGWQHVLKCQPGALAARAGMDPPIVTSREWLADVLGKDQSTVSTVNKPDNTPNTALLILTEVAPLGGTIAYKGRAGIRREGGTIYGHLGKTMTGEDVDEVLYEAGQGMGGLVLGTIGSGKSANNRRRILNCLYADIFLMLYDPKRLADYSEFLGIFPIGVSAEHAEIFLAAKTAERKRREGLAAAGKILTDRHGRERPVSDAAWDVANGSLWLTLWEEFHTIAADPVVGPALVARIGTEIRLERSSGMGDSWLTQGGSVRDTRDATLRAILSMISLTVHRMTDHEAKLAGYNGAFKPSQLPPVPGMLLLQQGERLIIPARAAFVPRDDVDGSVYDHLYAPDGTQILFSPAQHPDTNEILRRYGVLDIWNLAKGPDGLKRLLADADENKEPGHVLPTPVPVPTSATNSDGTERKWVSEDLALAVVALHEDGADRSIIDSHPVWRQVPPWKVTPDNPDAKPINVTTITKAIGVLCGPTRGYLTKATQGGANWYQLTEAGAHRARALITALMAQVPSFGPMPAYLADPAAEEAPEHEEGISDRERARRERAALFARTPVDADLAEQENPDETEIDDDERDEAVGDGDE